MNTNCLMFIASLTVVEIDLILKGIKTQLLVHL